ncbi:DUF3800 domain-containing protein [Candidatus Roizmanbacteria bacterium]|nr:DUF3800 domain-containing protein [Candidatus Roizmanbacteria bacterium]
MLVFIDESGDPGLKLEKGSSQYFTVALVVFNDNEEAVACDQRIELLKRELNLPSKYEFYFKRNSHTVRASFLKAIAPYNFFYYGIVINKDPQKLWGNGFKDKNSFYKYACSLIFENAKNKLAKSTVIVDESGNLDFKRQLSFYLKKRINLDGKEIISKIKMQRSTSNHLIQLADYVAGVINRSVQHKKKYSAEYKRIIAHREIVVQIWPK